MASFLCPACSARYNPVTPPVCLKCGMMFKSREGENHVCGACIEAPMQYRIARASGVYNGTFRDLVHTFKYRGKTGLSKPFALLLLKTFFTFWGKHEIDLIVPVPLHIKRFRKRGFNQAFLLIRDWVTLADTMEVKIPCRKIEVDVLKRSKKQLSRSDWDAGPDRKTFMMHSMSASRRKSPGKGFFLLMMC